MGETSHQMLLVVSAALILLTIYILFVSQIKDEGAKIRIYGPAEERFDIAISGGVPIGCFIPPENNLGQDAYNRLGKSDLKEHCLNYEKGSFLEAKYMEWAQHILPSLNKGIQLDGYCTDCSRENCLCLTDELKGSGEIMDRRSIDFGYAQEVGFGSGFSKRNFVWSGSPPSVFAAPKGSHATLSAYAGLKLSGDKFIEKITAALYNGTVSLEENRISGVMGAYRSCYYGSDNPASPHNNPKSPWVSCYSSKKNSAECACSQTDRYADEDPLVICQNYAVSSGKSSGFIEGCECADLIMGLKNCLIEGGQNCYNSFCASDTLCGISECEKNFNSYEGFENPCRIISGEKKSGCEKYMEFYNAVFRIDSQEYTIIKLGDFIVKEKSSGEPYRGPAFISANISVKQQMLGKSCYSPKLFPSYFDCCEELCREGSDLNCREAGVACSKSPPPIALGGSDSPCLSPQSGLYECSLDASMMGEDSYLICKNFCISHDAYYGDEEKALKCQEGCDWAARMEDKKGSIDIKEIEAVFIADTSGSMGDEWRILCDEISKIEGTLINDRYTLSSTVYALGEGSKDIDVTPRCKDSILNCSDINRDLGISLDCNEKSCYMESWGWAAAWAIKKHPWSEESIKVIFVISDEGPSCGGTQDISGKTNTAWGWDVDYFNYIEDEKSINRALKEAGEEYIIYGLWGMHDGPGSQKTELPDKLKDQFRNISEPTGGTAQHFSSGADINSALMKLASRSAEFNLGYDKYTDLSKKENKVSPDEPYYWTTAYDSVYSNLIYIVDWSLSGNTEWQYPAGGSDWMRINLNEDPSNPGAIRTKEVRVNFLEDIT
jgi:hypothetical protein